MASEDARFYEHHGVDTKGVLRAFVANQQAGGVSQGASTLTMQYVRNVQRDSAETPQRGRRGDRADQRPQAARDAAGRRRSRRSMTKEQILEGYLNVAYFGHRAYGIYAAAEVYFSKQPKDLTLAEAAMLAGLVKAPSAYDPAEPRPDRGAGPAQLRHRPDDRDQVPLAASGPPRRRRSRSSCS